MPRKTDRRTRYYALAGRVLGTAARKLETLSLAYTGASLDREVQSYAFPLLTDSRGLSFPITDRQSLNHFLVYGPKSAARSRLLLDIAESKIQRGAGLLHISTHDDAMVAEIQERTRGWSDAGQIAIVTYTGAEHPENRAMIDKVFDDRWRVFVRLPDPAKDSAAADAAAACFCDDLMRMSKRIEEESTRQHWRGQYNWGSRVFRDVPTPIVFDDASWYVGGLSDMQHAMLKALGFSIVHGLESDATFGARGSTDAARVLANTNTKIVMGDEVAVTCGGTPMPRLDPAFFRTTAEVRKRAWRPRTATVAQAA